MGKNTVKKEDFSKFSIGEIPVSTGPVPALHRTYEGLRRVLNRNGMSFRIS